VRSWKGAFLRLAEDKKAHDKSLHKVIHLLLLYVKGAMDTAMRLGRTSAKANPSRGLVLLAPWTKSIRSDRRTFVPLLRRNYGNPSPSFLESWTNAHIF
jgi:hypothetical protein